MQGAAAICVGFSAPLAQCQPWLLGEWGGLAPWTGSQHGRLCRTVAERQGSQQWAPPLLSPGKTCPCPWGRESCFSKLPDLGSCNSSSPQSFLQRCLSCRHLTLAAHLSLESAQLIQEPTCCDPLSLFFTSLPAEPKALPGSRTCSCSMIISVALTLNS